GTCRYELEALKQKYPLLTDNHIRVVSISADADRDVYESASAGFPWPDRLWDGKGFDGENFLNYGIVGTPTFILVDREGLVRGRYARLSELLKD
ncbi:MAG: thioredoxin family protein, partial [Tannerellaceae bacterium]|nr:thioredoxin family protein [Tannerellaceae bacterium]